MTTTTTTTHHHEPAAREPLSPALCQPAGRDHSPDHEGVCTWCGAPLTYRAQHGPWERRA
jgi:hypothetical protein